jgi:hypothetical protein
VRANRPERPETSTFYIILSLFRIAAILQGIARRAEDGTAADPKAAEMGRTAGPLADIAWDMVRARCRREAAPSPLPPPAAAR